ncbi:glycosyltransferase family 1 protein [bacterium]|nr:glycosyltransferase family 1 protein [bacterium]
MFEHSLPLHASKLSPQSLRVALFTGNYQCVRDGVALTLNRLVKFLDSRGVHVMIFSPYIDKPAVEPFGNLETVPSVTIPGRKEYRFSLGLPQHTLAKLQNFNPNLIHVSTPDALGLSAIRFAKSRRIPMVGSYHTHFTGYLKYYRLGWLEKPGWQFVRWFYKQCRHVYVPTPSMAAELRKHNVAPDIRLWSRGVDTELFEPDKRDWNWRRKLGFNDHDKVVLLVSRLVWEKNLSVFVNVMQEAMKTDRSIKTLIVGDGPARTELQRQLPQACFTGTLSGEILAKAYASSDMFFFPSETETFGNVTLEAMSSGLPVIVANATGSVSLVQHGATGFAAEPKRIEMFVQYILQLSRSSSLREHMSKAARQKAMTLPWEKINSELLDNYYQALRSSEYTINKKLWPYESSTSPIPILP